MYIEKNSNVGSTVDCLEDQDEYCGRSRQEQLQDIHSWEHLIKPKDSDFMAETVDKTPDVCVAHILIKTTIETKKIAYNILFDFKKC